MYVPPDSAGVNSDHDCRIPMRAESKRIRSQPVLGRTVLVIATHRSSPLLTFEDLPLRYPIDDD
jgi:hypothetical protein